MNKLSRTAFSDESNVERRKVWKRFSPEENRVSMARCQQWRYEWPTRSNLI